MLDTTLRRIILLCFLLVVFFCVVTPPAGAFTFSGAEAEDAREETGRRQEIARLLSATCKETLLRKRTAILIGETSSEMGWQSRQGNYGPHFDEFNRRLHEAGIKTFSQEEIKSHIAQEEIEAVLANDPDRAIAAAKSIGGAFFLRGTISTKTRINPLVHVNEVSVTMIFSLVDADGRTIASIQEVGESYAGGDTLSVSLQLVRDKAEMVVARLYNAYCVELDRQSASQAKTSRTAAKPAHENTATAPARPEPLAPSVSGSSIKDF